MLVSTSQLSLSQRAALEELIGRKLSDEETVRVDAFVEELSSSKERQEAADKLRSFLEKSPRPRPGVSEEEVNSAILDEMRSVRGSNYTEVQ